MTTKQLTKSGSFSDAERVAMKERAKELAAEAKANKNRAEGEKLLLAAIAKMSEPDKSMATKLHAIISKHAPVLWPKTWYGMPAYAKNEKVVCFFQNAGKFQARYSTLGFNDSANLDDGNIWPTAFALMKLTEAEEKRIIELVKKAL